MSDTTFMCRCEPVEKTFPNAKPIIFNTEMTKAILKNRKTVTRRVVKPQPSVECRHSGQHEFIRDDFIDGCSFTGFVCRKCGYGVCGPHFKFPVGTSWLRPPYRSGDILYVREIWAKAHYGDGYIYRADDKLADKPMFRETTKLIYSPSINMPREAARIFLRVTDVRVEKLQDINMNDIQAEGVVPDGVKGGQWQQWQRDYMKPVWDSTVKPKDRELYGWDANPYVWCVSFERMSKEEAYKRA